MYTNLYWASVWTMPERCALMVWIIRCMSISQSKPVASHCSHNQQTQVMINKKLFTSPLNLPDNHIDYDKSTSASYAGTAMHNYRTSVLHIVLSGIDVMKEVQHTSWVCWDTMIRPSLNEMGLDMIDLVYKNIGKGRTDLKMVLINQSLFTSFDSDKFPQCVPSFSWVWDASEGYFTKIFGLIFFWPVTGTFWLCKI